MDTPSRSRCSLECFLVVDSVNLCNIGPENNKRESQRSIPITDMWKQQVISGRQSSMKFKVDVHRSLTIKNMFAHDLLGKERRLEGNPFLAKNMLENPERTDRAS